MEKINQLSVTYQEDWESVQWIGEGSVQKHKTIQYDENGKNGREVNYVTATILLSETPLASDGEKE
jgi:hypothetical protein